MINGKKIFFAFLICSAVDVFNKNFYLAFSDTETVKKIYWSGQSFSFLCYVVFIWYVSMTLHTILKDNWSLLLKLATLNWIAFAISDFIDEVTGHASDVYLLEYGAFAITIWLTITAWNRRKK